MLKQQMEGMAMIMMAKVAEFMKEDIVLKDLGQTYDVQVQVDVSFIGAAAPVGRVMLDCDLVICKSMPLGQGCKPCRQLSLGLTAHRLDFPV